MIERIFEGIPELVGDDHYGRKILAYYRAYGAGYDFCKFYRSGGGIIHTYNTNMVICGSIDIQETELFIKMTKPAAVEVSSDTPLQLGEEYVRKHRTMFQAIPGFTDVEMADVKVNTCTERCFEILSEGFENLTDYSAWYVDISHRIRHGSAVLYLYDSTTISQQFNINGNIFLSHIATAKAARGKGTARRLLYKLAQEAALRGERAYLFALDHRRSFYENIGFTAVSEDFLYELV